MKPFNTNHKFFFSAALIILLAFSYQTFASEVKPDRNISGFECTLLPEKEQWQIFEIPHFKAYIPTPPNTNEYLMKLLELLRIDPDKEKLRLAVIVQQNCQVQVDKQWYRYINPEWTGGMEIPTDIDWILDAGAFISISLNPEHWITLDDSKPLLLEPGKHTISFGWAGIIANSNPNSSQKDKQVLLASKPVKIEILEPSEPSEKITETEKHRRRVTELFNSYTSADILTKEEQKLGLKTDLITFNEFLPKYTWEDIPFLLELAQNDNVHKNMPKLGISSNLDPYGIEGMIALWLIEGLRCKQVSLEREKQICEKLHVRSYDLPLNAKCIKKNPAYSSGNFNPNENTNSSEYLNLTLNSFLSGNLHPREKEQLLEIHKAVLQAYNNWWKAVGSLPASQASAFHPLDLADVEWYGGESYKDETLVVYKEQTSDGTIAERTIRHFVYRNNNNQPDKTFQTIYYTLRNPDENPPFTPDMLKVQKIVLYYYDKQGNIIRKEEIRPTYK